jgi:hypothetical protein
VKKIPAIKKTLNTKNMARKTIPVPSAQLKIQNSKSSISKKK